MSEIDGKLDRIGLKLDEALRTLEMASAEIRSSGRRVRLEMNLAFIGVAAVTIALIAAIPFYVFR